MRRIRKGFPSSSDRYRKLPFSALDALEIETGLEYNSVRT